MKRPRLMFLLTAVLVGIAALAVLVRWLEPRVAFFPFPGESQTPHAFGVPFDAVTIGTDDGESLRAWRMTAAAPRARIVYFHGNGGNLSNWTPILAAIVRRGYSVFAVDYRGYGLSTGHPSERGLYRDVDALLTHAWNDAGGAPLVYWGRSLGGTMAAYAATVRKPDGVIVESGFPDARSAVRSSPALALLSLLSSYRFPTAEFMNRAGVPALLLHGDRDSIIPIELGRELAQRIGGRAEVVVIRGGDHNDAAPPDPAAYWAAIDRFIEGLQKR